MSNELKPRIGEWYAECDSHNLFRVVALDAAAGLIEIQDFDGAIAELDREMWRELALQPAEAPEDSNAAYDASDADDAARGNAAQPENDWRAAWLANWPAPERWQDTCTFIGLNETQSNRLADLYARELEREEA